MGGNGTDLEIIHEERLDRAIPWNEQLKPIRTHHLIAFPPRHLKQVVIAESDATLLIQRNGHHRDVLEQFAQALLALAKGLSLSPQCPCAKLPIHGQRQV